MPLGCQIDNSPTEYQISLHAYKAYFWYSIESFDHPITLGMVHSDIQLCNMQ